MTQDQFQTIVIGFIIPWCVWLSVSVFNQRQEIALLRQIFEVLKEKLEKL